MQTIQSQKPFQFSFSSLIPNIRLPERGASRGVHVVAHRFCDEAAPRTFGRDVIDEPDRLVRQGDVDASTRRCLASLHGVPTLHTTSVYIKPPPRCCLAERSLAERS